MVTALGADAPEIASAVAAVVAGHQDTGVGVVVGSNVFYYYTDYVDVPFTVFDLDANKQKNAGFLESQATANGQWDPSSAGNGGRASERVGHVIELVVKNGGRDRRLLRGRRARRRPRA